jgi:superoxide dismutase, Fe-Mn family
MPPQGTIYEHYTALELTKITGRNAQTAHLFNFASMAHNNHMFFRCLQAPTGAGPEEIPSPVPMPLDIAETIKECFNSVDSFRETFLSTALGMFGPGFVWLMQKSEGDKKGSLTILCTYNAGSPYPEAHWRHQQRDMNITNGVGPGVSPQRFRQDYHSMFGNQHAQPQNMLPGFASHRPLAPGGAQMHPILCVNLWEHAWVPNFGIANKHEYLTAWWERIDWNEVFNLGVFQKDFNMGGFRNETTRTRNTKYLEQMERRARVTR